MRLARVHGLVGVACLVLAAAAYAQSTAVAVPDNAPVQAARLDDKPATWGDAKAGQSKAGACAACHGVDGNAMQQNAPRIAGMPERYIAQQLALFKHGERTTGLAGLMAPYAAPLSNQDMRDLGAWFATQKAGSRGGDAARGIPACMACHGPAGAGNPGPAYPALHGQETGYVVRRLEEYRAGTTTYKDAAHFNLMASVAKPLSDEEIRSLGSYVQGLHARADATQAPASH